MGITKEITWNGFTSADIPELVIGKVTRSLIGAVRSEFVDVPGVEGSWHFGERRGRRLITAECFIQVDAMSDRRDAVTAVANWLDMEDEGKLYISDQPGVYYWAVVAEAPDVDEWRFTGVFDLKWSVQPYCYDDNELTESWDSSTSESHFFDPALEVFVYPFIYIRPTDGNITSFSLMVNGDILTWAGNLLSGSLLTINTEQGVVLQDAELDLELTGALDLLTEAYDYSDLAMTDVSGDFGILREDLSQNLIEYAQGGGTATSITIEVKYRKRYRR